MSPLPQYSNGVTIDNDITSLMSEGKGMLIHVHLEKAYTLSQYLIMFLLMANNTQKSSNKITITKEILELMYNGGPECFEIP